MRRMAGSVCIVATGRVGHRFGLTATSVTSLCMDPPALLVCLNRNSSTFEAISVGLLFSVNLLAEDQVEHARMFCSTSIAGERRFTDEMWKESLQGIPYLATANASVLCEVEAVFPYGSHAAFIGRPVDVLLGVQTAAPLLYFDGDYRSLLPGRS